MLLAVRAYENRSQWAREQLSYYAPDVFNHMNLRLSRGSGNHTFLEWKLLELLFLLEEIRPKTIVEFGSGITTFIFARYAAAHGASVTTVDETAAWQEQIKSEFPAEYLDHVTWECRSRQSHIEPCGEVMFYEQGYASRLPDVIDLAYVDGPICIGDRDPCVDAVKLACSGRLVRHVLFDYRIASAAYLLDSPLGSLYESALNFRLLGRRQGSALGATDRHHSHCWLRNDQIADDVAIRELASAVAATER